ncbi:MAG: SAM-dependent methyltransferase [Gemmataceae bacterium]|nr:SAM-dependent methyltransferase [Gemmataceae bacterium]
MLQTYQRIRELAPAFAQDTLRATRSAHNEAEFERQMNNEIERLARELGVDLFFREQYTLATGRADAVYNRLVIEYEPPGSLRRDLTHGPTAHAVEQVKNYIAGLAQTERHERDRLLGVAFDGSFFIFVRYHQGHWIVEEPLPVNPASCERFLRSLFSLSSGRALIPENLVEDFGNHNPLSQEVTRALYHALSDHADDLTARLFEQWQLFFGETAGYEAAAGQLQHKAELRDFLQGMGLKPEQTDMPRFFFALQTYFAFIVKNIARLVLQAYAGGALGATPLTTVASLAGDALRRELRNLESGGFFRTLGLKNLLEGDFFAWYLDAWDASVEAALGQVLQRLADYNPVTVQDDPHSARDLLKKLYHYLLPREIRHDLGEFYTPDWLAEHLLAQLDEPLFQMPKSGAVSPLSPKRLLDPACGSGTFLVLAARALKANCRQAGLAEADTLEFILHNLAGLDLNPLAVMAARVNFLLAIADLLPYRRREVELPIYLADSILTPTLGQGLWEHNRRILETAVGPLPLPLAVDSRAKIEKLTDLLEEYITGGFTTDAFLQRCRRELPELNADSTHETTLRDLFERLQTLHRDGLDGIWARVIKNAFMPLFLEPFDYIVGNPPWINWESLPQAYRDRSAPLWQELGLFVHSGMDTILGKGKKDLSTLMTYAVIASFLKAGGKLGFVITQSVWKTSGAGQGFRRFRIGENGPHLRVIHVDDLSRLQVFEGASTRTSVFVLQKGQPTCYPVDYTYWQKISRGRGLDYDSTLEEVLAQTRRLQFQATPVDPNDPTSAWLTARPAALGAVQKVLGKSDYQAHAGATTWANSVYWLEKVAERPDGLWIVRNVTEGAKRKVEAVTVEMEPDLLYPLVRGRDVQRWLAQPSAYLLMTQDPKLRRGLDPKIMQSRYPKTWAYLKRFEAVLRERSGFKRYFTRKQGKQVIETGPFYSIFNVGDYTFAPWKVVWPNMGDRIVAAVISEQDGKPITPQHIVTILPTEDQAEAFYIAATVNSIPFQFAAHAYSQAGGKSFGTPEILEKILVPRFDRQSSLHVQLSTLSRHAHALAPVAYAGDATAQAELAQVEAEIDRAAARLWGLTEDELDGLRQALSELKGEDPARTDEDDEAEA